MSAESLVAWLRESGIECAIEARDRLAIITVATDTPLLRDDGVRREIVTRARAAGFTNVAVEIDTLGGAALSRD